jgi:hypothetical protein
VFLLSEAVSYAFRKRAARSVQDGKITRELADHKVSTKRLATSNTDGDVANNKLKRAVKNLKWSAERIMSAAASSRSTFQVGVHAHPPIIDDYAIVCAIVVKNIGSDSLERCTVRIDQYSGTPVAKMPFPLTLRTEGQVRGNLSGAVSLSAGQATTIPILFKRHQRANEWYFFDEFGKHYFVEANPMEIVISVYGGNKPEGFLLTIETDTGWHPIPSVRPVPDEFSLSFGAGFKRGLPDVAKEGSEARPHHASQRLPTQSGRRITLVGALDLAEREYGWDFQGQQSLDVLDFIFGLHQAGVDGDIKFYGKPNRNSSEMLTRNERLVEIDPATGRTTSWTFGRLVVRTIISLSGR